MRRSLVLSSQRLKTPIAPLIYLLTLISAPPLVLQLTAQQILYKDEFIEICSVECAPSEHASSKHPDIERIGRRSAELPTIKRAHIKLRSIELAYGPSTVRTLPIQGPANIPNRREHKGLAKHDTRLGNTG